MESFSITKNDQEDIIGLMNISYSLLDSFNKLKNLEINGSFDNNEYKKTIEHLKTMLQTEESFYNRFGNHPSKLQAILNHFTSTSDIWDLNKDIKRAISNNKEELVKRRIVLRIIDKICNIRKNISSLNDNSFNDMIEISIEVKKDIINTILNILNLYINNLKYKNIINNLETLKYNFAFLYQFVESDFLANNFFINPDLYWIANFISNVKKLPDQIVNNYNNSYANRILENALQDLMQHNYYSLRNNDNYANAIISQILIRVGLLFSNEEVTEKLQKRFQNFISINQMLSGDNTIENIVMEAIELHDNDKGLPKIVHLGINR